MGKRIKQTYFCAATFSEKPKRGSLLSRESIPAFHKLRREAFDPTHDRRERKREAALRHYFDDVSKAELVAQILAHRNV